MHQTNRLTARVGSVHLRRLLSCSTGAFLLAGLALTTSPAAAGDWPSWRGPHQNGVSEETGLISSWSKDGENLIWRQDFTGRSTPVVFDGRVCANGRVGEGVTQQEVIACWDAGTGKPLWERRYNVYHTTVPFNRVGWGNPAGDPETGYLYAQNVDGQLVCLDRDGKTVWEHRLAEQFGRVEGYGGRTHTPVIDEDRLYISVISTSWGEYGPMIHRYFAFDKKTGEILWISPVGGQNTDKNTHSTPSVMVVDGRRILVGGTSHGTIVAYEARTGRPMWDFHLSQRGINASVVVNAGKVFAAHSEENLDEGVMGRVVALDSATGKEVWRAPVLSGYSTPLLVGDRLYVVDNSSNMSAFNAETGAKLWEQSLGTVGKSAPVWADGKIYYTEVNGNFYILEPKQDGSGVEVLDEEHIEMPSGRYAEIYASPAVAYGRIYFTTEEGIYCLGDKSKPFQATPGEPVVLKEEPAPEGAKATHLQVVPADVRGFAGEPIAFSARFFDDKGRPVATAPAQPEWSLAGVVGEISPGGSLKTDVKVGSQAGHVVAKAAGLENRARVNVGGPLPWNEDFEAVEVGKYPAHWIGAARKMEVQELDGGKVLVQPPSARGVPRINVFIGPEAMSGYTIQADLKGSQEGRKRPDLGIINSGYSLDLQGNHQRIEVRSWAAMLRMAKKIPFEWSMDTWYTAKLRVDYEGEKAIIRGKVWPRDTPEPQEWTITVEDPLPIRQGSPGLYGYSPVNIYFDNLKVTVTE